MTKLCCFQSVIRFQAVKTTHLNISLTIMVAQGRRVKLIHSFLRYEPSKTYYYKKKNMLPTIPAKISTVNLPWHLTLDILIQSFFSHNEGSK